MAANIPAAKEPSGLLRSDGKRPDGLTLIPWKNGRCVTWDVTVTDTLARSYLPVAAGTSGGAAEAAAGRDTEIRSALSDLHVHSSRRRNHGPNEERWTQVRKRHREAHHPSFQ